MLLNFKEYVYREHWRGDPLRVTSHAACSPLSQSRFDFDDQRFDFEIR